MKSLLSIIGVKEFEAAAAKATRRAAKATLAVSGSYLGMIDGHLVTVKPKARRRSGPGIGDEQNPNSRGKVSVKSGKASLVIRVKAPTTKIAKANAVKAEKAPRAIVPARASKRLAHG